jgi:hypothetical protein
MIITCTTYSNIGETTPCVWPQINTLRVAKYGSHCSKSSVPKINPWCFVVAENTPKLPRSRMACCCRAHAQVPVVGDAVEDIFMICG